MELFFTLIKPHFKNILNLIELPLGYFFYTTQPFVKKNLKLKTSGESLMSTIELLFFIIRNYAMEWCHKKMNKQGFLN